MKGKIEITQKDIDELKERLKGEIDKAIGSLVYNAWHKERCGKYKLKLKVGDKVKITKKDLIYMGYPEGTKIEGKITKIERYEESYPPYVAYIETKEGRKLFGIGWLKRVR